MWTKRLCFLLCVGLLLARSAYAPPLVTRQATFTSTGTFNLPAQVGTGINQHKLIWYLSNSAPSACTIELEGSNNNGGTWTDIVTGTCTSGGVSAATTGVYSSYRLNLSAYTSASGTLTVTYAGYLDVALNLGSGGSGAADQIAVFDANGNLNGLTNTTISHNGTNLFLANTVGPGSLYISAASVASQIDNGQDIGLTTARWRSGYFGTSIDLGGLPAQAGRIRLSHGDAIYSRNGSNNGQLKIIGYGELEVDHVELGNTVFYTDIYGAYIRFMNLQTTAAGLPSGAIWNNGGVINIVP
jgi:hypothetical protein